MGNKPSSPVFWGISFVFALSVAVFFAVVYPGHLHYQEQFQLFSFYGPYASDVMSLPGGLSDWTGRLITDSFRAPFLGGLVLGLLVMLIQQGVWRLCCKPTIRGGNPLTPAIGRKVVFYILSFIPATRVLECMCDEDLMVGTVVALVLLFLVANVVEGVAKSSARLLLVLVATPVLYFIAGPLGLLYPVFALRAVFTLSYSGKVRALVFAGVVVTSIACPLLAGKIYHLTAAQAWGGIHYHRLGNGVPMVWVAITPAVVIVLLSLFAIGKNWKRRPVAIGVVALLVAFSCVTEVYHAVDLKKEDAFNTDRMAEAGDWDGIIALAEKRPVSSQMQAIYLNLALAMKGELCNDMFRYNQHGPAGLYSPFGENFFMPLATAELYYRLGALKAARQFYFEIMQSVPDYQASRRCMRRLADIYMAEGEYKLADKHIKALAASGVDYDHADINGDDAAVASDAELGLLRSLNPQTGGYFDESDLPATLQLLIEANPGNSMAWEYLMAYCMLQKDMAALAQVVSMLPVGAQLPVTVQEALVLYWDGIHGDPGAMPWAIADDVKGRFEQLKRIFQTGRKADIATRFSGSFWEYYFM